VAPGRFLRDNAFLVAAVALPGLVVLFFLLATGIPSLTVDPPRYDVVIRGFHQWDGGHARVGYDVNVRNGRIEIIVRALEPNGYSRKPALFLFDHRTLSTSEIPVSLEGSAEPADLPRTIVVDVEGGRRISPDERAPDGYVVQQRAYHNSGLMGDVFGMHRYTPGLVLTKGGRTIEIKLPTPFEQTYEAYLVGWVIDDRVQ